MNKESTPGSAPQTCDEVHDGEAEGRAHGTRHGRSQGCQELWTGLLPDCQGSHGEFSPSAAKAEGSREPLTTEHQSKAQPWNRGRITVITAWGVDKELDRTELQIIGINQHCVFIIHDRVFCQLDHARAAWP